MVHWKVVNSNLNLVYTANTLDTFSINTGEVQRVKLKKEEKYMPVKPRITVNSQFCIDKKYLFIVSGLKADNESSSLFENNAVVDLYDVRNGHYYGSIYVPLNKDKIKSLYILDNKLVVLYSKHISVFPLVFPDLIMKS